MRTIDWSSWPTATLTLFVAEQQRKTPKARILDFADLASAQKELATRMKEAMSGEADARG